MLRWWLRILAFIMAFSIFLYGFRLRSDWVKQIASYFVYPILLVQHVVVDPIKQQHDEVAQVEALQNKMTSLQKEYQQLLAENVQLKASLAYLRDIKELSDFKKRYQKNEGNIAQVLVRHFSEKEHYFYIDGGSNKQFEKDMVVLYKNNLIGKITEVYPWYSKVALITDKHCKVAAYCNKTKAQGIHQGANEEASSTLRYVNHLEKVQKGDLVLSSGEGLVFPQGFALGTIKTCQTADLYKEITVEPRCDLRRLDYCYILPKNNA